MGESNSTAREEEISRRLLLAGTAATAAVVLTGCAQESKHKESELEVTRPVGARRSPSKATKLESFFPSKEAFTQKRGEPPEALRNALERYGWSLPLCVWSDKMDCPCRE